MTDEDLIARLRWHSEHPTTGKLVLTNPDGPAAADRLEALAARVAELEAERVQILRREEEAWRRANHAEAKVRGWQSTLVVRDLPMMSVPVTGWGPGEGEQTAVPQITPERLTDILDRLARAEAAEARAERLEKALRELIGLFDGDEWYVNESGKAVLLRARAALTQKDRTDG